jgi:hypothetical protein
MTDRKRNETEELAKLAEEVYRDIDALADKVGVEPVREMLRQSFAITNNPALRAQYDALRLALDAHLRSKSEGTSAVREPAGFQKSPNATTEQVAGLVALLAAASRKPLH